MARAKEVPRRYAGVAAIAALILVCSTPTLASEPDRRAILTQLEDVVDLLDPDFQSKPINAARLPRALTIKAVHGSGRRTVYTFEDPNCGYCRTLTARLGEIGDVTVYTYMLPILGDDSVAKVDAVWCASDRDRTWHALMLSRTPPPAARADCRAPTPLVREIAEMLGVRLTPTVFFADGSRMVGLKDSAEIRARLERAQPRR